MDTSWLKFGQNDEKRNRLPLGIFAGNREKKH
jgi:hypothetical protein